jgi:autotransporter passenger strand-loop-strand repeat protein
MSALYIVSGGSVSSGLTISGADQLAIASGGTAVAAIVFAGGYVDNEGSALATTVSESGVLNDLYGNDSGTVIGPGGTVLTDNLRLSALVYAGNGLFGGTYTQYVTESQAATVSSGGVLEDGGVAAGTKIAAGGLVVVSDGAFASNVTVQAGGLLVAEPGAQIASATGTVISTGVYEATPAGWVANSSSAGGLNLASGQSVLVLSDSTVSGIAVGNGGSLTILEAGSAASVTVSSGGTLLDSGGVIAGLTELSGGVLDIFDQVVLLNSSGAHEIAYSTATNLSISRGGIVESDGVTSGVTVASGGLLFQTPIDILVSVVVEGGFSNYAVDGGTALGLAENTLVQSGGVVHIALGSGTVVQAGGQEDLVGTSYNDIVKSGAFEIVNGLASGTTISSGGSVLVLSTGILSGADILSGAVVLALDGGQVIAASGGGSALTSGLVLVTPSARDVINPAGPLTLSSGSIEYVLSGGDAVDATVLSGAEQSVQGGITSGAVVVSGGTQVSIAGTEYGTVVSGGVVEGYGGELGTGTEIGTIIRDGGVADATNVNFFGAIISNGGVLDDAEELQGLVSGTVISSGGTDAVGEGSADNETAATVSAGGTQIAFDSAYSTTVLSGGLLYDQWFTSGAMIGSGGVEIVTPALGSFFVGPTGASNTDVQSGGFLLLVSGGQASGTTGAGVVLSGGVVVISANGAQSVNPLSQVVLSGGAEYAFGSGVASGAFIGPGARQTIFSIASNTLVDGGVQAISAGVSYDTDIVSGGTEITGQGIYGLTSAQGGGGTAFDTTIGTSGLLDFGYGALSGSVLFAGSGGGLDDSNAYLNSFFGNSIASLPVISGFAAGDELIMPFGLDSGTTPLVSGSTIIFNDIDQDTTPFSVTLAGCAGDNFSFTTIPYDGVNDVNSDGEQTVVTIDNVAPVACFTAGTRILTARGEMTVEMLMVGDEVVVRSGKKSLITWIGHRHIDCRRHPKPQDLWPVRVLPDAFGPATPHRELWLSPDHAVFTEGILIPIRVLINGTTITQESRNEITYWHVELARHDVLFAEGLLCESYLDTGTRLSFTNDGDLSPPRADFGGVTYRAALWEATACAPLRIEGPAVERAVARLTQRASALGFAKTIKKRRSSGAPRVKRTSDLAELVQPSWYLAINRDVASAGVDSTTHYVNYGRSEGRMLCPVVDLFRALGLIDADSLIVTMPDVIAAGIDPVEHFFAIGWTERRQPNAYFDTGWYLDRHDVPAEMNPLLHYLLSGENEGLPPSPHFDPAWYRQRYNIKPTASPLAHYLMHRRTQRFSPLPSFDVVKYLRTHESTMRPGRDPYAHFLAVGKAASVVENQKANLVA